MPFRFLLIFIAIMIQPFLTNVTSAEESYDDCRVSCNSDKGARDVECPSSDEFSDSSQRRDQCLQKSRDTYDNCIEKCPPPPPPPRNEPNSSPMSY